MLSRYKQGKPPFKCMSQNFLQELPRIRPPPNPKPPPPLKNRGRDPYGNVPGVGTREEAEAHLREALREGDDGDDGDDGWGRRG